MLLILEEHAGVRNGKRSSETALKKRKRVWEMETYSVVSPSDSDIRAPRHENELVFGTTVSFTLSLSLLTPQPMCYSVYFIFLFPMTFPSSA